MLNFSQSKSSSFRVGRQKNAIQIPMSFKISQPKCQNNSRQMTTQYSLHQPSDSGNSYSQKNAGRSFSNDKLQQHYISYKLKPSKGEINQSINLSKDFIISTQPASNFYGNSFYQSKQHIKRSQMASLTKSPQFYCKGNSQDSVKQQSISKQHQNKFNQLYNDENSFCKQISDSQQFQILEKYKFAFKQDKNNQKKQIQIQAKFNDSVINDNYDDLQLFTPYKQLKQQFQRQQKLYEKQMKLNDLQQFDSFNQKNQNQFQKVKINETNDNFLQLFQQNKRVQYRKQINQKDKKLSVNNSDSKNGFFFLTNPIIQSNVKLEKQQQNKQNNVKKSNFPKNDVQQFCFNLSTMNIHNEDDNAFGHPYSNKNLFSNSNDHLFLFDSKAISNQNGSFGSKKIHIKQLVEEFVDQLQNLDQKSLNEKDLNNLEDVLGSIVFKQSKAKKESINTKKQNQNYYNLYSRQRSPSIQTQSKKWRKLKHQISSSSIATQRKALKLIQSLQNQSNMQSKRYNYEFQINSSNKKINQNRYCFKSPQSNISTERKQTKKQSVYKPNFIMCKSKSKKNINNQKQNQNNQPCKAFTNSKEKQQLSHLKINPKSSIYVKKGPKSNRQHLKTQTHSRQTTTWRMY